MVYFWLADSVDGTVQFKVPSFGLRSMRMATTDPSSSSLMVVSPPRLRLAKMPEKCQFTEYVSLQTRVSPLRGKSNIKPETVGSEVGGEVGTGVGMRVGITVGIRVGKTVGNGVGPGDGAHVDDTSK